MKIEVLGPGCPRCEMVKRNVKEALEELGIDADVELVVENEIKCQGRIPSAKEIKGWLQG